MTVDQEEREFIWRPTVEYRHGLIGCDLRCNPYTDGWKDHAKGMRGHNSAIEIWRLQNERANDDCCAEAARE